VCADEANKYKYIWDKANCKMDLQRDIMGTVWTDNRVIAWTRSVADKSRFGVNDQGDPKIVEITTIHGVLETKLPMMVDSLSSVGSLRSLMSRTMRLLGLLTPGWAIRSSQHGVRSVSRSLSALPDQYPHWHCRQVHHRDKRYP